MSEDVKPELTQAEQEKLMYDQLTREAQNYQDGTISQEMYDQIIKPFERGVRSIKSNKKLQRILIGLVRFPFVDENYKLGSPEEKFVFMLGERILHAKMVKKAQNELQQHFDRMEAQEKAEEAKKSLDFVKPEEINSK